MGPVVLEWLVIAAAVALCVRWPQGWAFALAWVVIGSRQMSLWTHGHEGAHYLVHRNRKINDAIVRYAIFNPLFISLGRFRRLHFAHHRHLKTDHDPEGPLMSFPEFRFPRPLPSLLLMLALDLTGLNFLRYNLPKLGPWAWALLRGRWPFARPDAARAAYYTVLLAAVVLVPGAWLYALLCWLVPYATWFPFCMRLRLMAEHFHLPQHARLQTRTVKTNALVRLLFMPNNVNYHAEHHVYPQVPAPHLPALHRRLMAEPAYRQDARIAPSYWHMLREFSRPVAD